MDNAFFVELNGRQIGFSKGSRLVAEFDVSDILQEGMNEIYVKVYTYSDASYLECQDMIFTSGIFRDVYLIQMKDAYIWDYRIQSTMDEIAVKVLINSDSMLHLAEGQHSIRVEVAGMVQEFVTENNEGEVCFKVENPIQWNAEAPFLYDVYITLLENDEPIEVHSKKVGLREAEIIDGLLCVNKKPIRLKGINRHEYVPDNGRAVTYELTRHELEMIKANNINAVRCSHYPNNPYFYEICSELGLYVVDEVDLETHGAGATGDQGYLSKDNSWLSAYLDRAQRTYERDKNETCIIIWSLGNESGRGDNIVKCAEYFRKAEIKKPLLYTSDLPKSPEITDFFQPGYCPMWVMGEILYHQNNSLPQGKKLPILMTEFAHGMGNSPGLLYDYQKFMYENEGFAGGFVWEFKNHGILKDGKYLYGGDFGEANHKLNFCIDGYLFSDGTPKPSWYELKQVFSPIWAEYDNGLKITNTYDYTNLSVLDVFVEILEGYQVVYREKIELDIAARCSKTIAIGYDKFFPGERYRVNITAYDGENCVTEVQVELPYLMTRKKYLGDKFTCKVEKDRVIGENFEIRFENGMIAYYEVDGKVLLNERICPSFYRKPIDNDAVKGRHETVSRAWDGALLKFFDFVVESHNYNLEEDEVIIKYRGKILPEGKFLGFVTTITYKIYKDGLILTELECKPYGKMPEVLSRIGVLIKTDKQYDHVIWYGRGKHENYHDRKYSARFGLYQQNVEDFHVNYERPQDNGNRCDNYFMAVTDDKEEGLLIVGKDTFDFTIHNYSMDALVKAEHIGEIEYSDNNFLYVDYKTRGVGNAACGSAPEEEHELRPHSFRFVYLMGRFKGIDEAKKLNDYDFGSKTESLSGQFVREDIVTERAAFECRED